MTIRMSRIVAYCCCIVDNTNGNTVTIWLTIRMTINIFVLFRINENIVTVFVILYFMIRIVSNTKK